MQSTLDNLELLEQQAAAARAALRDALRAQFPKGMRINVFLSARQVNPTPAEVAFDGYSDGEIRVRLLTTKKRSGNSFRSVHYSKIT